MCFEGWLGGAGKGSMLGRHPQEQEVGNTIEQQVPATKRPSIADTQTAQSNRRHVFVLSLVLKAAQLHMEGRSGEEIREHVIEKCL